jgi:hypothetical protein
MSFFQVKGDDYIHTVILRTFLGIPRGPTPPKEIAALDVAEPNMAS